MRVRPTNGWDGRGRQKGGREERDAEIDQQHDADWMMMMMMMMMMMTMMMTMTMTMTMTMCFKSCFFVFAFFFFEPFPFGDMVKQPVMVQDMKFLSMLDLKIIASFLGKNWSSQGGW